MRCSHRLTGDASSKRWPRSVQRMPMHLARSRTLSLRLTHQTRCVPRCHPTLDAAHFGLWVTTGPREAPRGHHARTAYPQYVVYSRRLWYHHPHGKRSTLYHESTLYHDTTMLGLCQPPSSQMRVERLCVVGMVWVQRMVPPCAYAREP